MERKLWVNTGELSGDMQASSVVEALYKLDPSIKIIGMGGSYLESVGQKNLFDIGALSVMGGVEILTAVPRAIRMLRDIREAMKHEQPSVVLLVDAPEFNFRVAKIANSLNIPVYYFIPPKVWAWRPWRVRFLQQYIRRIFCILPFEEAYYRRHGIRVDYVGNPLVDRISRESLMRITPDMRKVGILPGSRKKEVTSLMPIFGDAARILMKKYPDMSFACLKAPNMDAEFLKSFWPTDVPIEIRENGNAYEFMRGCGTIMAASGTAVLETALCGIPTVVAYKISKISSFIGRRLICVKWVSLPNLILNREVFPECLMEDANPSKISSHIEHWLENSREYRQICNDLEILAERCGNPGAAERTARAIYDAINGKPAHDEK